MGFDYKSSYAAAKAELARVENEKLELQSRIEECEKKSVALIETMRALAPLAGEKPPEALAVDSDSPPAGMTDCIRAILTKAEEPLTASEIRESLESIGFDMKSYSNPLATVHTILRRLGEAGEVESAHEMVGAKKFTIPVSKHLAVEKIMGKDFRIGGKRGFIGVGRLVRRSRVDDAARGGR